MVVKILCDAFVYYLCNKSKVMNKKNAFTVVLLLLEKMVNEMENNVIFVMLVKEVLLVVKNWIHLNYGVYTLKGSKRMMTCQSLSK